MVEKHGSVMNHNPTNLTYLEKSIPEEKEPDHRREQKHESKQPRVEEIPFVKKRLEEEKLKGRKPFNPFARIKVNYMLSLLSPQFYTEEELATIKEICQGCYHQQSLFTSPNNTVEEGSMSKMNKSNKKSKKGEPTSLPPLVEPLPDLPVHVRNMIANLNGMDVRFVMCKKLFDTDLNPNNNRLSMPLKEIKCDFLTEIEKAILDSKENGKPVGLEVTVLDPSFKEYTMQLKKWEMRTSYVYNLVTNWKQLLLKNNLRKNSFLNIWSFRVDGKLYFTLNNKRERS